MASDFPTADDLIDGTGADIGNGDPLHVWMGSVGDSLNDLNNAEPPETAIRVNSGAAETSLVITKQPVERPSGIPQPLPPLFGFRFPGTPTFFTIDTPTSPVGICAGPGGFLYGAGSSGSAAHMLKIALDGTFTSFSLGDATPNGICVGPDGNLWVADVGDAGQILRIAPDGTGLTSIALQGDSHAETVCAGPDGNIWVADIGSFAVWRVTPDGTATRFSTGLTPFGVCAGPDGNIWAATTSTVIRITPDGEMTTVGPTMTSCNGGICQGADGNLWLADLGGDKVYAVAPDGTIVHTVTLPTGSQPYQLCSGAGGDIWVTANATGYFYKITTSGEATGFLLATGARPYWVCSANDGGLWITDDHFNAGDGPGGIWLEPFIMQAGGLDLNAGPLIVKGQEITAGLPPDGTVGQVVTNTGAGAGDWADPPATTLPPDGTVGQVITNTAPGEGDWEDLPLVLPADGTPGQVVTNTAPGEGDWEDLPTPPIGLPPDGTPGQVVTNTSAGQGDWEDLPAPPIGLPSDGTPGQVVTNTAPGEGDWEDLPAPPIGLPADGTVGQVVTNTSAGHGDWEDLPAPPIGLPADGTVGQVVTNTAPGEGDWANVPVPVTLFDSVTIPHVTVTADGNSHQISLGDGAQSSSGGLSLPRPWLDDTGVIQEPGLYRMAMQLQANAPATTSGLYLAIQVGDQAQIVPVDGLAAFSPIIASAVFGFIQTDVDFFTFAIPVSVKMPTDATLTVDITPTFSRLLAY